MLLVKVNSGTATHVAKEGISGTGVKYIMTHCGSEEGKRKPLIRIMSNEIKEENITCKKCLKAFQNGNIKEI